ncbi:MAG TPA: DNA methyltransferase [Pirellulales bacterium]|nr:DNA methyltransferase [Pirellulales bacterium]
MTLSGQPRFFNVPLDTATIPQNHLNIDNKARSNLLPWNGQFSPQLVEVLLQTYAKSGSRVLDPFVGSGTVLHEAGRCGFPAFGSDINPAAFKMASIYSLVNLDLIRRRRVVEHIGDLLNQLIPDTQPLFAKAIDRDDLPVDEKLMGYARTATDPYVRRLLEGVIVLLNFGDNSFDKRGVNVAWAKLRNVLRSLPFSEAPIELANCDARYLPLRASCVDLNSLARSWEG